MRVEEQFLYPLFFAFSPFTDVLTIAWHTYPVGTVGVFHDDSYIGYSYGINSPDTGGYNYAWFVMPSGGIVCGYGNFVYDHSYGSPDTVYPYYAYYVRSNGNVYGGDDFHFVDDSYGK